MTFEQKKELAKHHPHFMDFVVRMDPYAKKSVSVSVYLKEFSIPENMWSAFISAGYSWWSTEAQRRANESRSQSL